MMEIYVTCLLQILSFSSPFRRFQVKNFLRPPTMVADIISQLVAPTQNFCHFYGPVTLFLLMFPFYALFVVTPKSLECI